MNKIEQLEKELLIKKEETKFISSIKTWCSEVSYKDSETVITLKDSIFINYNFFNNYLYLLNNNLILFDEYNIEVRFFLLDYLYQHKLYKDLLMLLTKDKIFNKLRANSSLFNLKVKKLLEVSI